MPFLLKLHSIYGIYTIAKGPYYKIKFFSVYVLFYFRRILGFKNSLRKAKYISITTGGVTLPFFIKDNLDFDVLLDSMFMDQYALPEIETREVRDNVKVIFDLGTNIGTAALKFYQKFPKATIYCFEPDPFNFERLKQNISLVDEPERIKIYNYAISGTDAEKVSFYRGVKNHWSSSLTKRSSTEEEVVVETITLDTFCKDNKINHIDILKMDIEGAESDAMEGFKDNLSSVDYVIGEIHPGVMKDSIGDFVARFEAFEILYLDTKSGVFKFKK